MCCEYSVSQYSSNFQTIYIIIVIIMSVIQSIFKKLFWDSSQWSIGLLQNYQATDILEKDLDNITWFTSTNKKDFFADPFLTNYFGEPYLFFEEWIDTCKKGRISYINIKDVRTHPKNAAFYVQPALDIDTHLSFPYLFEYQGELYMVPENYHSGSVSFYKNKANPGAWEKIATPLPNFPGIDTIVFPYMNYWWMISTKFDESIHRDNREELYIWYAKNPFADWHAHPLNPITYNGPIARAAGAPFTTHEGKIYRPVQDCTKCYGGSIILMEITKLTCTEFSENPVQTIAPIPPYDEALHTYSAVGNLAVVDGIRGRLDIGKPFRYLYDKLSS